VELAEPSSKENLAVSTPTSVETPAEDDVYRPSAETVAQANVPDWEASAARAGQDLTRNERGSWNAQDAIW
jgi:hypothetical protein